MYRIRQADRNTQGTWYPVVDIVLDNPYNKEFPIWICECGYWYDSDAQARARMIVDALNHVNAEKSHETGTTGN